MNTFLDAFIFQIVKGIHTSRDSCQSTLPFRWLSIPNHGRGQCSMRASASHGSLFFVFVQTSFMLLYSAMQFCTTRCNKMQPALTLFQHAAQVWAVLQCEWDTEKTIFCVSLCWQAFFNVILSLSPHRATQSVDGSGLAAFLSSQ